VRTTTTAVVISMADYLSFSHPWTYQSATAKKAMVKKRASRSHMKAFSLVVTWAA
jgi:hypothetical protein